MGQNEVNLEQIPNEYSIEFVIEVDTTEIMRTIEPIHKKYVKERTQNLFVGSGNNSTPSSPKSNGESAQPADPEQGEEVKDNLPESRMTPRTESDDILTTEDPSTPVNETLLMDARVNEGKEE